MFFSRGLIGANSKGESAVEVSASTLSLNGSSQYLTIGDNADLGTNDISMAIWVKTSVDVDADTFISKEGDTGGWYALRVEPSGKPRFAIGEDGSNYRNYDTTSVTVDDDAWHLLGVSYDRSSDTCIFYVDGSAVATTLLSSAGSVTSSNIQSSAACNIGNRAAGSGSLYATGDTALALISFTVLTSSDFLELYNDGTPKQPWLLNTALKDSTELLLPINDQTNSNQYSDYSGNGNDATATGSPTLTGAALTIVNSSDKGP